MSGPWQAKVDRILDASVEEVWEAWTDASLLADWIVAPGCHVEADVRVGGSFRFDMGCEGQPPVPHTGRYLALERPRLIEFTWVSPWTGGESRVRIDLEPVGAKTRFRLVHEGLPDEANAKDHEAGWNDFARAAATRVAKGGRHASAS